MATVTKAPGGPRPPRVGGAKAKRKTEEHPATSFIRSLCKSPMNTDALAIVAAAKALHEKIEAFTYDHTSLGLGGRTFVQGGAARMLENAHGFLWSLQAFIDLFDNDTWPDDEKFIMAGEQREAAK